MTEHNSNYDKKIIDLRGESSPVPEITANKELHKIHKGELVILIDHQPAIEVTLPSLCKSLGLKYDVIKKEGYVEFVIYKDSNNNEEEDYISFSENIIINSEANLVDKLIEPTIIMSFVPQIKAVEQLKPGNFLLHIKWVINWETPLYLDYQKTPKGGIIYYTAFAKLPMIKIRFGWTIIVNKTVKENIIDITEWYSGPLKNLASSAIKKHLQKAKEVLPALLTSN
ncbi:sulfurtransferase TusA family protein [Acidianus sulfidivorans JP7]|uniref:Sulfurtransferase TusA family protein n=1 Tax=Acidianus sulfidivorans JP7 TaxID=619593 RepID=A0A2U9IPQ4_9CREN|nr:sulfurtransferase TusA family protein [Acidianus sulfidivorans]AWR98020.1 sulfurtransferase TusA family protein [Acidianus sulfidivorans JP7]